MIRKSITSEKSFETSLNCIELKSVDIRSEIIQKNTKQLIQRSKLKVLAEIPVKIKDKPYLAIIRNGQLLILSFAGKIKTFINFSQCFSKLILVTYLIDNKEQKLVQLIIPNKQFQIHVQQKHLQNFIFCLSTQIKNSNFQKDSPYTRNLKYWKESFLYFDQINQEASTLDLLFFKSNRMISNIHRLITGSEFDHVAVFLRNSKKKLSFMECICSRGVRIILWEQFIKYRYYERYEKMGFRKYYIKRSLQLIQKVQKFIRKSSQKKYRFEIFTYLKSFVLKQDYYSSNKDSYFCSSFIAELFKEVGILDQKVISYQILPGTSASPVHLSQNSLELNTKTSQLITLRSKPA